MGFEVHILTVAALVVVGTVLMLLGNAFSRVSPRGETRRNLLAFFAGTALIAGGLVYLVIILRSLGN